MQLFVKAAEIPKAIITLELYRRETLIFSSTGPYSAIVPFLFLPGVAEDHTNGVCGSVDLISCVFFFCFVIVFVQYYFRFTFFFFFCFIAVDIF
jgi:hypothetical protein